jgi:hypothetical protein
LLVAAAIFFSRQQHLHAERIAKLKDQVSESQRELDRYADDYDTIYKSATSFTASVNEFSRKFGAVDDEATLAVALDRLTSLEKSRVSNDATLTRILSTDFEARDGARYYRDTHAFFAADGNLRDQVIGLDAVMRNGEANPYTLEGTSYEMGYRAGAAMRRYVIENSAVLNTYSSLSAGSVASGLRSDARKARQNYEAATAEPFSRWILSP